MMTFLLFTSASMKWLGWRNVFCDTYCTVIFRYSFAWYSVEQLVWKFWTKRRSLSKNLENLPDTSLSFTNRWLETICQTQSFLLGQRVLCIPSVPPTLPTLPTLHTLHIIIIVIFIVIVMIIFFSLFAALVELFLMDLIQVRESCAISREVCAD